ncbi:MAG: Mur ligase family protein [Candidatus Paceibacteria bacterium]
MQKAPISENIKLEAALRFLKRCIPRPLLDFIRPAYHYLLSFFAALIYMFPSRQLFVIGITGTKGKSTVVELAGAILREAGKPTATLSSLYYWIGNNSWENTLKMTVPGRLKLQRFLKRAKDAGAKYLVLEMTSEGIKQHRHRFIKFDIACLINLHPEHIEAHGSFEAYRNSKFQLFKIAKFAHILNADDKNFDFFNSAFAKKKIYFTLQPQSTLKLRSDDLIFLASNITLTKDGSSFSIDNMQFNINLVGRMNVYNALCAISIARALKIPWETIQEALKNFPSPPGRFEFIDVGQKFHVVVDFAHTPDSLKEVYDTVKELFLGTNIISVFGATGGGRDKWKRPVMGKIAAEYSKKIILTNEDPYDEDPYQILQDIKSGIPVKKLQITELILDRRKAIETAIRAAQPGDTVVITGKGGEQWMALACGKKIPWSDSKIARETLLG